MVSAPKLVFADEPTANLDSKSADKLLDLFSSLNETTKTTFLFSSHDPRVLNSAKRVISLMDGTIKDDYWKPLEKKSNEVSYLDPIRSEPNEADLARIKSAYELI